MVNSELVDLLQELRFSEYEAKAYIALLDKSPATGYAVSLHSGVPRSKIYAVLGALVKRGDVILGQGKPAVYTPLNPMELVERRRKAADDVFATAKTSLKRYVSGGRKREDIWNVAGRDAILSRVREVLRHAEQRVLLEIWKEEAEELRAEFAELAKRKVLVQIVAYGNLELAGADVYHHDMSHEITMGYGRWIVLSVDDREAVAGSVSMGEESRAAWSVHPGLVVPITEVVLHDLYVMEMMKSFRPELEKKFGKNLIKLRKKFSIDRRGGKTNPAAL